MTASDHRGPRPLSDILGSLFAARGYGRLRALGELEAAWTDAVGEPAARQTKLGGVRHGVLTITVAHPALLEELSAFRKPTLLAALRTNAPGTAVHDLRFRVGPIEPQTPEINRSQGSGPRRGRPRS